MTAELESVDAALTRAAKVIEGADVVALACHVTPDGDALGSTLALHHVLAAAGRHSVASFPAPFRVAPHYRDLPGLEALTRPEEFPTHPEVMVTFDCGSLDRLASLRPAAEAANELIVVDHHISNDRYGSINVIDPAAAASGVLVRRLIDRLGLPLNDAAAVCLYAALVCDTGRFQYESTDAGVFDLASELVTFDVPVSRLSRTLFEEHRFAYLQLLAEAVGNAELVREQSFVWAAVTQDMLCRHDVSVEEVEGLIDIVRRTAEADVACVLKEEPNGTVKVSLRSVGAADVRHIASAHGGGGHRFAAGFTSDVGIAETVDRIRAASDVHDGLVVVDKPAGFTSHDVVAKLRKCFGQKRIGHAGTLDPDATGVLLVGLGRVTRLLRFLQETTKAYRGTIAFGVATDTLDAAGAVLERRPMPVTESEVLAAMPRFTGELQQVPPMVSALKVDGRRLHELARAGEEVERKPRAVRIDRFECESFVPGPFPRATVLVECSSGTYIRSLAADLGAALGGPAHLAELRRLRVGSFTVDESHPLDLIEANPRSTLLSPVEAMRGLEQATVDAESARAVAHGSVFPTVAFEVSGPGPYAVVDEGGTLLAVYERRGAGLKPSVVLPRADGSAS